MKNILKGYKVVELASVLAGPLAGSFLAESGATVLKIENSRSNGDVTRQWKLAKENENTKISAYYASANTGKVVLKLDLSEEKDYQLFLQELNDADIIISNFQKKTAEKLKVDFNSVQKINKSIIYAQLTAYDYDDPRPGYDLVMQAEAGFISMNGTLSGENVKMPVALVDVIAGHQLKEAILLGVISQMKTGKGYYAEVSLYKSAISALANQASNYLMVKHNPNPFGTLHPNIAPYGDIVTTKDSVDVILAIGSDNQFEKLGKTLKLAQDFMHTFIFNKDRVKNRIDLMSTIRAACIKHDYKTLYELLSTVNVPFCRIADLKTVFENPLAKQMIINETIEDERVSKVSNIAFHMEEC